MNGFDQRESISGVVENVVYRNENNDYTVLEIVDSENNLITAVGIIPMAFEGESVVLTGEWTYHKEFGKQFAFDTFEKRLPEEIDGILQYLSSKTVKGVGPVTALKIVNRFGVDTFDVLENHPEWLADIPGITMKKAAAIAESFREQTGIRNVMMFCKDYMEKGEVTRVYKRFGASAIGIIRDNPYILCNDGCGIPFDKADAIARDVGISPVAPTRILAGINYALAQNAANNGHTCLPKDRLISVSAEILSVAEDVITSHLSEFISSGELAKYVSDSVTYIMTPETADDESYIAARIAEMDKFINHFSATDIYALIDKVESQYNIRYADLQRRAIFEALNGSLMILTGGPGTGKTTVVKGLISIFESIGHKCILAAPTGRAAKRLSEATDHEAKTIHRMLEMERTANDEMRFFRDSRNPLDENVVIIDEASMIDLSLTASLFRALKRGARLIMIGDSDQLPSVGSGNVLADFISAKRINTVCLSEIFRQSKESLIVTNAHRINNGEEPILNNTTNDFFFVRRENERDISSTIADLVTHRLPKTYGERIRTEIQVVTPSKKGLGGVNVLNTELQDKINPPTKFKKEIKIKSLLFREGDRVMQTSNNYEIEWKKNGVEGTGVFNGDIGIVERIDVSSEEMVVRFDDDRVAHYDADTAEELDLAYAITVHKSQGSEYPVVIIPAYYCPPMLLTRNLLYTAVTRAKKMVIIVGRSDIPKKMVENNMEILRYTTLGMRIADAD